LSNINQKSIVVFLHLKELSTKNVHIELVQVQVQVQVQVLRPDAIACSTMTKNIRNNVILQNESKLEAEVEAEAEAEDRAKDQAFSITDIAILKALEMMPFAFIRKIVMMIFISPMTGFRRLTKSLHFVLK
jgi:hypothetical protein